MTVSVCRVDQQWQASGSVKCGDERSLQCQRLGCDIFQRSALESLAATLTHFPSSLFLFLLSLLLAFAAWLLGDFDSQESLLGRQL